jgi:hypothetical protein
MLEAGCQLDLAQKALGAEDGAEFRAEHLDGHLAPVLEVLGEIDRGHAAGAEFPLNAVAVGEGHTERGDVCHEIEGQTWAYSLGHSCTAAGG